jgi:hypothetical protein
MPQRLDTIEYSPGPLFGVLPFDDLQIYQGPGNATLKPQDLWGKRVRGDNTTNNFNSYQVPVSLGINVDLFKKMAEGHSDTQVFKLLRYGFPLDV